MALIKNAYTPGQWYVFFYEAKNIEQSSYYDRVEKQFSSWYSFLQKDQIQGKVFDFLGVPNYCGKINKKQLHKVYLRENSRHNRFGKLDVQVKRIQLTDNPHLYTKTFRIFTSKNARNRSDKNTNLENTTTRNELPNLDERRNIEGKNCSFSKNDSKLQSSVQLNSSKQTNIIYTDDSNNNSLSSQSDAQSAYLGVLPGVSSLKKPSSVPTTLSKKKVEFNNENEYFFFKEINSSTTHSSHTDELVGQQAKTADINDNSSNDDDNAFDTGFSSPVQDFCSASPLPSQEIVRLHEPTALRTSAEVHNGSLAVVEDDDSSDNACDTGFLSPVQDFNSSSPLLLQEIVSPHEPTVSRTSDKTHNGSFPAVVDEDGSNDDDNAFDTGFLSPPKDFRSDSPLQNKKIASPTEASGSNNKPSLLMTENEKNWKPHDNNFNTFGFLSPVHESKDNSDVRFNSVEKDSATVHSLNVSQTNSESVFSVDRRISGPLSVKSTDDEILTQTSAMTELFATSIMVDLRIPGALQSINDEYKKMFDTLTSEHTFLGTGRYSQNVNIATAGSEISIFGNRRNQVLDSLIEDNTILHGRRHTFPPTDNVTCGTININSQDELMGIRKLNLNSIENGTQNLDDDMSNMVERVYVSSGQLKINSTCDKKSQQEQSQSGSMEVNPNSLEYMENYVLTPIKRKIRKERNSGNDKADESPIASPSSEIKKWATPLGKKRLPLKKRSFSNTPKFTPHENAGVSSKQIIKGDNTGCIDEARQTTSNRIVVEQMQLDDAVAGSVAAGQNCSGSLQRSYFPNENKTKDIAVAGCKRVEGTPYGVKLDMMKTKKHIVDLASKLSLRHISELFFNDPDVSTKFREGSLSCSAASRGTSSKSTHTRKNMNEQPQAESNLASSGAHEFEEMDLNPSDNYVAEDKTICFIEQAVTPTVSVPSTNDFTRSPSPQSAGHSESGINLDSPFVKNFLENTEDFMQNESARVSQIYDMETPSGKAALGLSPTPKKIPATLGAECHFVKTSVVDSHTNFIDESVKSVRFSVASSPSAVSQSVCCNNENITPLRNNSSSGSDDSLRVLPSTSQRKAKKPPMLAAGNFAHCNFSFSSKNSDTHSRSGLSKDFGHSKIDEANVEKLDGVKSGEEFTENVKTDLLKSADVVPLENPAQGKRMSFIFSNVITKPVGSQRQSNEHDFLICDDQNSATLSLPQDK